MSNAKLYPPQDPIELGAHYTRHIEAMTAEGLHSKADIAEQLAWRDLEIENLRRAVSLENDCSEQYRMEAERLRGELEVIQGRYEECVVCHVSIEPLPYAHCDCCSSEEAEDVYRHGYEGSLAEQRRAR
jgi:hypothetical protein